MKWNVFGRLIIWALRHLVILKSTLYFLWLALEVVCLRLYVFVFVAVHTFARNCVFHFTDYSLQVWLGVWIYRNGQWTCVYMSKEKLTKLPKSVFGCMTGCKHSCTLVSLSFLFVSSQLICLPVCLPVQMLEYILRQETTWIKKKFCCSRSIIIFII